MKENSFVFAYQDGVKVQLANYQPEDYLIKNNIIAFRNLIGGVSALVDGKIQEITNQSNAEYQIYGDVVLVKLFNKTVLVLKNGKILILNCLRKWPIRWSKMFISNTGLSAPISR